MSISFRFILIGILFFVPQQLVSKIAGSNTAVSVESLTTFPAGDLDNAIFASYGQIRNECKF